MNKIAVAMSGGVDSSTAAALLKKEGHKVLGLTMCLAIPQSFTSKPLCCSPEAIEDARKVCELLDIPHYVLDFKKELTDRVVHNFIDEYLQGRTPNPCVRCNRYIKFGLLLKKARTLGADCLATGHYARLSYEKKSHRYFLRKARDSRKDQSYFLYGIKEEFFPYICFPLGDLTKQEVRIQAKKFGLSVSSKPASQEICFVGSKSYKEFIKLHTKNLKHKIKPGPIKDLQANTLGTHKGICFYTIGQREGLGISTKKPLYVIKIDHKNNIVYVGSKEDICSEGLIAKDLNLFIDYPQKPFYSSVKIRYNHTAVGGRVHPLDKSKLKIIFEQPQPAVTPGQSVVLYDKDIVLGGGVIEQSI